VVIEESMAEQGDQRRLAAILAADVASYTRLIEDASPVSHTLNERINFMFLNIRLYD